jgi:hypothetical protein
MKYYFKVNEIVQESWTDFIACTNLQHTPASCMMETGVNLLVTIIIILLYLKKEFKLYMTHTFMCNTQMRNGIVNKK